MKNNPNSLSAISLAIATILTEQLDEQDLNTLGLLLSILGDMLQLNAWEISQNNLSLTNNCKGSSTKS